MIFTFKIDNAVKKLFTGLLMSFVSGAVISAITVKTRHRRSEKKEEAVYYAKLMDWIEALSTKEQKESNSSLKGVRIFLAKENETLTKNIIKLYFCEESNDNWKEVVTKKFIKTAELTADIKKKLDNLKRGEEIEITDMIFKKENF